MAVRSLRGIKPVVWIPPVATAGYRLTVGPSGTRYGVKLANASGTLTKSADNNASTEIEGDVWLKNTALASVNCYFDIRDSASIKVQVALRAGVGATWFENGTGEVAVVAPASLSANRWYRFHITYNPSTNLGDLEVFDESGTSLGSQTGMTGAAAGTGFTLDDVRCNCGVSGTGTGYYDNIAFTITSSGLSFLTDNFDDGDISDWTDSGAGFVCTTDAAMNSELDITDLVTSFRIENGVTEGTGVFEFEIPNPDETYTSLWTGLEIFRFYADYNAVPSTPRFGGRIEKPSNSNHTLRVTGRSDALFVMDRTVSKSYDSTDAGAILKDFFDTFSDGRYDTSSISTSTGVTLSLKFVETPFWEAVTAVCDASGYDCYIDALLVVQFFLSGSINNTTDGVVHDYNLLETGDFAPDLQFVKNKIRVYGGTVDGVQIMYTANDTASQTAYGVRKHTESDDTITTYAQAKEVGDYLLEKFKDPPIVSDLKAIMIPTISPGENLWCSSPAENISPARYRVVKYVHELGDSGLTTEVTLNKEPRRVSHVIRDRIQREHKKQDTSSNPNDLDFSVIDSFETDTGTHSNTEITEGVLKLSPGQTTGTWTSAVTNSADNNNVNQVSVSIYGDNLPGVTIEVSANNGLTYTTVSRNELKTITATGKALKIRLSLSTSSEGSSQIDAYQLNYSTTT